MVWRFWWIANNCVLSDGDFLRCHRSPAYFTFDVPMSLTDTVLWLLSFPVIALIAVITAWWVTQGFSPRSN